MTNISEIIELLSKLLWHFVIGKRVPKFHRNPRYKGPGHSPGIRDAIIRTTKTHFCAAMRSERVLVSSSDIACLAWISLCSELWRLSSSILSSFCERRLRQFLSVIVEPPPTPPPTPECFRNSSSSVIFVARAWDKLKDFVLLLLLRVNAHNYRSL